ncbi:MAG: S9 family peptidase [Deltaproteobacteria bacterium]|nr:S9 family peptidase [Deltaproteobacteria bacterium]
MSALLAPVACATAEPATPPPAAPPTEAKAPAPAPPPERSVKLAYPKTTKGDVVEELHGAKVPDPYRWLEDPDSAETAAWVKAQNEVTFGWLERVPARAAIKARLTELWDYERYSPPSIEGKGKDRRTFFFKNNGLQNQSVLYAVDPGQKGADDKPRVLLDPNALSADGTVALSGSAVSDDGKLMAYSLSSGGSDWQEWRVKDVATGTDRPDVIKWSKFSRAAWTPDNKGFFYARYPAPKEGDALEEANYFHKIYYHRLGEPQDKDQLVVEDAEHKTWGFDPYVTEDGKYLVVTVWDGTDRRNRLWFKELGKKGAPLVKLFDDFDAAYGFVGNQGSTFFIQTDREAPRQRVVAVDVNGFKAGAKPALKELIAQADKDKLESVTMIGGGFLVQWLQNAHTVVTFHELTGKKVRELPLPTIGTTSGFAGKSKDKQTFYAFTSFTYPTVVYQLDLDSGVSTLWRQPTVKFTPADYETKQVFYPSKDGTQIPMFLVHKKGVVFDGKNPTYLYAYGGFNISLTPQFSPGLIAWLERGGVYAQPTLRGGGEFGEDWHAAGMLEKKQNVFDDFAAAADWLVANKVTRADKLGIGGGSNGGLLVGASITQHPEKFGAAVAMVGVMDMLRFHKFTIGHAWVSEYGSADDAKMFPVLRAYSPLHALKAGTKYPATLITTADHDDRVVPAHSFKFAAAIQEAQAGETPVLIRVDVKAGHGAGKPTTKVIEELADRWSFLLAALGVEQLSPN